MRKISYNFKIKFLYSKYPKTEWKVKEKHLENWRAESKIVFQHSDVSMPPRLQESLISKMYAFFFNLHLHNGVGLNIKLPKLSVNLCLNFPRCKGLSKKAFIVKSFLCHFSHNFKQVILSKIQFNAKNVRKKLDKTSFNELTTKRQLIKSERSKCWFPQGKNSSVWPNCPSWEK